MDWRNFVQSSLAGVGGVFGWLTGLLRIELWFLQLPKALPPPG